MLLEGTLNAKPQEKSISRISLKMIFNNAPLNDNHRMNVSYPKRFSFKLPWSEYKNPYTKS